MTERMLRILNICCDQEEISIKNLAELLSVTEVTIRKDLDELEQRALISNKRGVISLAKSDNGTLPYSLRSVINIEKKVELSKYVASLVKDNQIVFVDGGSTLIHMFDYITTKNNVFVTPGIEVAMQAAKKNFHVFLLPGFVNAQTYSALSPEGLKMLDTMHFDIALVGASGISRFYQFATNSNDSAQAKHKAIQQATKAYVVADSSKYSVLGFSTFASFDDVALVSDREPDDTLEGIHVIVPASLKNNRKY